MDFNESAGTFLRVDVGDGWFAIQPHEESVVRKAIVDFRERGIDSLVEIEDRHGSPIALVASTIVGFRRSTPELRATYTLEEIRQDEWERDFRKAHAAPEWEG
jgi:hypothetical protein